MGQRQSVRAIVIKDQSLLVMKRNKFGRVYYTLVGGDMELGEEPERALRRELYEEASLEVGAMRPVYMEDASRQSIYGIQYIYLCEYKGGEPAIQPTAIEALLNKIGQNTHTVMWLPFDQLAQVSFRSASLQAAILDALQNGFPETPVKLDWKPEVMTK